MLVSQKNTLGNDMITLLGQIDGNPRAKKLGQVLSLWASLMFVVMPSGARIQIQLFYGVMCAGNSLAHSTMEFLVSETS